MVWKEQFIGFRYLIQSITEFKEYHGINVSVLAYLDKTRIPISIDIGFGDVVHPDRVLMDFPVLLDMEIPKIYAYSLATAVSEKFEAIVSLGYVNSRPVSYTHLTLPTKRIV